LQNDVAFAAFAAMLLLLAISLLRKLENLKNFAGKGDVGCTVFLNIATNCVNFSPPSDAAAAAVEHPQSQLSSLIIFLD